MTNAITSQKLYRTFFELSRLPGRQVRQIRCKSITSAIKGGVVRENNSAARRAKAKKTEKILKDWSDRRNLYQEKNGRSDYRPKLPYRYDKRKDPLGLLKVRPKHGQGEESSYDEIEKESNRHRETPTDYRGEQPLYGQEERSFDSTDERSSFGRPDSLSNEYQSEQSIADGPPPENVREENGLKIHHGYISEFSGQQWQTLKTVQDVRILLQMSEGITVSQYRTGASILEDSIRRSLEEGQPRKSVEGIELMLKNLDEIWHNSKSKSASDTAESTAKRKLGLEHEMQRLIYQLPRNDPDKERWSRWISTSQIRRRETPLRIFDQQVAQSGGKVRATKDELVAVMQKLVQELPENDKDRKDYASHLRHYLRWQAKGESLAPVDVDLRAGRYPKQESAKRFDGYSVGKGNTVIDNDFMPDEPASESNVYDNFISPQFIAEPMNGNSNDNTSTKAERASSSGYAPGLKRSESIQQPKSSFQASTSSRNEVADARGSANDADVPPSIQYSTAASTFLYGHNVVLAALRAKRRKIYWLYTAWRQGWNGKDDSHGRRASDGGTGDILTLAEAADIRITYNTPVRILDQLSESRPHNGVVLEASYIPSPPVLSMGLPDATSRTIPLVLNPQSAEEAEINGRAASIPCPPWQTRGRQPFVVMLDGITDPGNVGNILRSAHFYGVDAVAIATNTCASIKLATLAKASSGACEAIPILSLPKPANFVTEAGRAGWKVYAAVAPPTGLIGDWASPSIRRVSTATLGNPLEKKPVLLMLGAEGEGLRANLSNKANYWLSIEQSPSARASGQQAIDVGVESLNVGVAAGVLLERFLQPAFAPAAAAATATATASESAGAATAASSKKPATADRKKADPPDAAAAEEFGIPGGLGF